MIQHSLNEHARSLADYLPNGRLFEAKNISGIDEIIFPLTFPIIFSTLNGSNFRQLLLGLSGELFTAEGYLITLEQEYIPDQTTLFLGEWESALGIPDDCLSGTGTIIERRRDILVKLASMAVQTADDFVALAVIYGITVTITSGIDARFTILVKFTVEAANQFPLTFPIVFGNTQISVLECLYEKIKPSNCNVIFEQI